MVSASPAIGTEGGGRPAGVAIPWCRTQNGRCASQSVKYLRQVGKVAALGVCDAACESALNLARSRTQGGRALMEQQGVQLKIGRMHMLTEALRSFVLRTAWEMDQGGYSSVNTVLVMNFSTDVIQEVTELNMAIHGAAGFTMNAEASKLVRDGIIWTHLAGDASQRLKVIRRFPKK